MDPLSGAGEQKATRTFEFDLQVPPKSNYIYTATTMQRLLSVPYTTQVQAVADGRQYALNGLWTGLAVGDLQWTYERAEGEETKETNSSSISIRVWDSDSEKSSTSTAVPYIRRKSEKAELDKVEAAPVLRVGAGDKVVQPEVVDSERREQVWI